MFNTKGRESPERVPTAEDFTPGAIRRAVLNEAVQHPCTIIPAGVGIVAALWLAAIDPNLGAIAVAVAGGLTSAASFWYHFFFRGEGYAEAHVRHLRELRDRSKRYEAANLASECARAGWEDGAQEASEIEEAYRRLREVLDKRSGGKSDDLGAERFRTLADDTYRQALTALASALNLFKALKASRPDELKREQADWKKKIGKLTGESGGSPSAAVEAEIKGLEMQIQAHDKRLQSYDKRKALFYELRAKCEELEAALEQAHLQLVTDTDPTLFSKPGSVSSGLERAVEAARKVEERLRGFGDTSAEDQIYLEAGAQIQKKTRK